MVFSDTKREVIPIAATAEHTATDTIPVHFKLRKLHSLSGIIPVGLFLIEHLSVNSLAATAGGERVFNAAVGVLRGLPYLIVIEILFIMIPILFHGVYGVFVTTEASVNTGAYSYGRNWMYVIQRVTGLFTFIFVVVHLWNFRIASMINPDLHVSFDLVRQHLAVTWVMVFYIAGVLASVFHFANGIWNFCVSWGITIGPRAQRACAWACAAVGLALSFIGVNALLAFVGKALIISI